MRIEPEIARVSLVMLGHFNPAIFTPAWFGWNELLPEKTVKIAGTKIVHPEIAIFAADWLNLHVQPESFQINTTQSPYIRLRDLAVRIFREHLLHTPLKAMGINRELLAPVEHRVFRGRGRPRAQPLGGIHRDRNHSFQTASKKDSHDDTEDCRNIP